MSTLQHPTAVALFSGGLDSILAAKLIAEQNVSVLCLHFHSPFFGKPGAVRYWERLYNLHIRPVDIGEDFTRMLVERPRHGFGSVLNPCVDCKILMLRHAKAVMEELGACCIISGEVLGQRPMSQRRDTLNVIRRDAGVREFLLRPLSALHLDPTEAELAGVIDRGRLLKISGRGRKDQLALAERFQLKEIPTPAGGCRLAEQENARSYWPVLKHMPGPAASDFTLANTGRQYWHTPELTGGDAGEPAYWLTIGRNQDDNTALMALARERDLLFKTRDFPGPIALGRFSGQEWPAEVVNAAASFTASYSNKAVRHSDTNGKPVFVRVHSGSLDAPGFLMEVAPNRNPVFSWREYPWEGAREEIRTETRKREEGRNRYFDNM